MLPGRTNVALVTGCGPIRLQENPPDGLVIRRYPSSQGGQIPLPSTAWIQFRSWSQLESLAAAMDAEVTPCASEALAQSLSPIRPGPRTSAPPRSTRLERFIPHKGCFSSHAYSQRFEDGLYKYELYGRTHYASVRNNQWYKTDRYTGIHLETPPGSFPLEWKPELPGRKYPRSHDLGQLMVNLRTRLPSRHQEAAVMCTGLSPVRTGSSHRYDGVPFGIASRIAETLRRRLETI